MASFHEPMPATSSQDEVLAMVDRWNADDRVDGILVQSPLPAGLDFKQVLERIDPAKDVDGFHPLNVGRLVPNQPGAASRARPPASWSCCDATGSPIEGADAVVVGRSDIVGKPVALLLLHRERHRHDLPLAHARPAPRSPARADILVAAVGRAADDHGRHGQAGRDGHRRRHQPHRRRARRRRRFRRLRARSRGRSRRCPEASGR